MLTFAYFQKVYQESGEVTARLIVNDVDECERYWIFASYPELASWLSSVEIREVDWLRLIRCNGSRVHLYLRYCDLSKRDFDFITRMIYDEPQHHHLLDFTQVSQGMWSRCITAVAREDIGAFYQYVDPDSVELSASALWKLEQYEMGLEK